jgi:MYXO-CTERM domain-containing protein
MFDAHGVDLSSNPSLHNEYYTLDGSTVNFDTFLSETADPLTATPEPSSIILASSMLAGLAGSTAWRKRRRR